MNESQSLTLLRTAMLSYLPGLEIVQGQGNRVPSVKGPNFVVFIPTVRTRLATNLEAFAPTTVTLTAPTRLEVMVYVYGPLNGDNAQILMTMLRSDYAPAGVLYATDPQQIPFVNGENQYDNQWVLTVAMQIEAPVVTTIQTADTLALDLVDVDAVFPPEPTP